MKWSTKVVTGALGCTAVIATVLVGPELVNAYKFMDQLDQYYVSYEANGGPWPQFQDSCALCHGDKGQPTNSAYPALAGQPATYLESQLRAFADGTRASPHMAPLAASLSQQQIQELASYFARQTPAITSQPKTNEELDTEGKALVERNACTACHGTGLSGSDLGPRIAGQGQDYLADQLLAFQHGARIDPSGAMNAITAQLTDAEIQALSHYLAGRPPKP